MNEIATKKQRDESLISIAWVTIHPELLMMELEKAMARLGITAQLFTFKVMTPIYPDDVPKLQDPDHYKKLPVPWSQGGHVRAEQLVKKRIAPLLTEFQLKARFSREEMRATHG